MRLRATFLALLLTATAPLTAAAETLLVMIEEAGCPWCARWNAEIAPIYPKTPEGQAAPLQRIDIHASTPEGMEFDQPFAFTPTFVLMVDGTEAARIEGYPGEDFFWSMLEQMLTEAGIDPTG